MMTMSHLLKQTKKCCVKIIRKFSFNPGASVTNGSGGGFDKSPTNNGHGMNNRITAKYVLHKNCTPTRCKVQPSEASTAFDEPPADGWFEVEATNGAGFHPLSEEEHRGAGSFRRASSPSARATPVIPETQNNYKQSRDAKNLPKKRTNITSNKNVNLRKCFRLRSKTFDGVAVGDPVEVVPPVVEVGPVQVPSDSSTLASNNSSSRLIGAKFDKISKSLMRGSSGGDGGDPPGVASAATTDQHYGAALSNRISKPLFLTAKKCGRRSHYNHIEPDAADDDEFDEEVMDEREEGLPMHGEALILTSSVAHAEATHSRTDRLHQETTLTVEEPPAAPSVLERLTVAETAAAILFEKVKYDRTKRYLIDQLTEGEPHPNGGSRHSSSCSSSPFHLAMAAAVASKSEDFVDPWKNYNIRGGASWDKVSKSPWDSSSAKASPGRSSSGQDRPSPTIHQTQQPPAPTTFPTRTHWNPASTVETWIDDETFDNSFNEELERRCTTLKICE
uniref:Uncharacterized protein n=1 Tax=Anopheles atroparvus TaxID=41427 RepID=A0A182JCY9_ANOAO